MKFKKFLLCVLALLSLFTLVGCEENSNHEHRWTTYEFNDEEHWQICNVCSEKSAAEKHNLYEVVITKASDYKNGLKQVKCKTCDYVKEEAIPALKHEHEYTEYKSDETKHWKECKVEGCTEKSYEATHDFEEKIYENKDGHNMTYEVCKTCGYTSFENSKVIHEFSETLKYDEENHWKECICKCSDGSNCTIKDAVAKHTLKEEILNASTETEKGSKKVYCEVCDYEEIVSIPVLNHTHNWSTSLSYNDNYHYYTCDGCDDLKDKEAHSFTYSIKVTATPEQDGIKIGTCKCGKTVEAPYSYVYEKDGSFSFETDEIIGKIREVPNDIKFTETHFNDSLKLNGPLTTNNLPSTGDVKVLVFPINLDNSKASQSTLNDIVTAFNGTSEETGWESVNSYYKKSSYNKLNITFDVQNEWFTPANNKKYYDEFLDEDEYVNGMMELLKEVLAYYDEKIDYSNYDSDKDGYFDAIWMIYNCDVDYEDDDSMYWAQCSNYSNSGKFDGVESNWYGFAGTDFMYTQNQSFEDLGYDSSNIIIDAHTFIHETGHLFGLDDYYDYDENRGCNKGFYGPDMMDYNIGDHCSFSKMLLGWIDPVVVTGTTGEKAYNLPVFTTSGTCLLIADHEITSIYDEYILIEFYSNAGLNENDEPIMDGLGIRVLHVDAHQNIVNGKVVENGSDDEYYTGFKYDNSKTTHPLVEMLRADSGTDYPEADCLYTVDSNVFGVNSNSRFKFNNGKELFFNLYVNNITEDSCTIVIEYK